MSSQNGSDGLTPSNSPTLVQANLTNFEILDMAKIQSGPSAKADASDARRQPDNFRISKKIMMLQLNPPMGLRMFLMSLVSF